MVIKRTTKKRARELIQDYISYLRREHKIPIQAVYLFGSYAKGKPRQWSDIDVAIISEKFTAKIDPYVYLALRLREKDIKYCLEPIGFHPKDFVDEDPLVWEIKQHGIRII